MGNKQRLTKLEQAVRAGIEDSNDIRLIQGLDRDLHRLAGELQERLPTTQEIGEPAAFWAEIEAVIDRLFPTGDGV